MRKTTIYLDPAELRILQRAAREQRQSSAELIRRAIRLLDERTSPPRELRSLGCVSSGGANLSGRVDELLDGWARDEHRRRLRR